MRKLPRAFFIICIYFCLTLTLNAQTQLNQPQPIQLTKVSAVLTSTEASQKQRTNLRQNEEQIYFSDTKINNPFFEDAGSGAKNDLGDADQKNSNLTSGSSVQNNNNINYNSNNNQIISNQNSQIALNIKDLFTQTSPATLTPSPLLFLNSQSISQNKAQINPISSVPVYPVNSNAPNVIPLIIATSQAKKTPIYYNTPKYYSASNYNSPLNINNLNTNVRPTASVNSFSNGYIISTVPNTQVINNNKSNTPSTIVIQQPSTIQPNTQKPAQQTVQQSTQPSIPSVQQSVINQPIEIVHVTSNSNQSSQQKQQYDPIQQFYRNNQQTIQLVPQSQPQVQIANTNNDGQIMKSNGNGSYSISSLQQFIFAYFGADVKRPNNTVNTLYSFNLPQASPNSVPTSNAGQSLKSVAGYIFLVENSYLSILSSDGQVYQVEFDQYTQGFSTQANYSLAAGVNAYVQGLVGNQANYMKASLVLITVP